MNQFDIAIVGGGVAGAGAALGLGQQGLSVAVIDPKPPMDVAPDDDLQLRVSTLSPASKNILTNLGAWAAIEASGRSCPFDAMRVWQRDSRDEFQFSATDGRLAKLGWVLENELVRSALWRQFEAAGVTVIDKKLAEVEARERRVRLQLAGGESIQADLLLGADGARSVVREATQMDMVSKDYQQSGLVCVVETEKSHQHTAWQRFIETGPLAFLPLMDGRSSVVWSLPTEQSGRLLSAKAKVFDRAITEASAERLGRIRCVSERVAFPLRRQAAPRYVQGRVVLLGDAAHVVHPLAGQGANLGLLDAAALVELLGDARQAGRDLADRLTLRRYERWRRSDNEVLAGSLDLIKAWFGPERGLLADVRRAGSNLINRSGFLRARLVQHASGFGGQVPKLAFDNTSHFGAGRTKTQLD